MSSEEGRPIAENTVPKEVERASEQAIESAQDAPLTEAELEAQMQLLAERARAAGLAPIRTLVHAYVKRSMAILDSLLGALEEDVDNPKKKGKK